MLCVLCVKTPVVCAETPPPLYVVYNIQVGHGYVTKSVKWGEWESERSRRREEREEGEREGWGEGVSEKNERDKES